VANGLAFTAGYFRRDRFFVSARNASNGMTPMQKLSSRGRRLGTARDLAIELH